MSTDVFASYADRSPQRVRHQARDAVAVMVFSAATSLGLATALLILSHLGHGA